MKVIVAGSRTITNYEIIRCVLDKELLEYDKKDLTIISGGANGVDSLGERYARENGINLEIYKANWNLFGKSAGPRRNLQMLEVGEKLIAFYDGTSRGTLHMINISKQKRNSSYCSSCQYT